MSLQFWQEGWQRSHPRGGPFGPALTDWEGYREFGTGRMVVYDVWCSMGGVAFNTEVATLDNKYLAGSPNIIPWYMRLSVGRLHFSENQGVKGGEFDGSIDSNGS